LREIPPHIALSFEAVQYIDRESNPDSEDEVPNTELYNLFEVFAAENKRCEKRASKLPEATPPPPTIPTPPVLAPTPAPPFTPATGAFRAPQFKYQANVKHQKLTDELAAWLLEGKLTQTTPAHILAASNPIRKTLAERLRPRHVETGAFEELSNITDTSPAPEQMTPHAADYTLPL
jgi:hypothetical protein